MQECGHAVVLQLIGAGDGDLGQVKEMGAIPRHPHGTWARVWHLLTATWAHTCEGGSRGSRRTLQTQGCKVRVLAQPLAQVSRDIGPKTAHSQKELLHLESKNSWRSLQPHEVRVRKGRKSPLRAAPAIAQLHTRLFKGYITQPGRLAMRP